MLSLVDLPHHRPFLFLFSLSLLVSSRFFSKLCPNTLTKAKQNLFFVYYLSYYLFFPVSLVFVFFHRFFVPITFLYISLIEFLVIYLSINEIFKRKAHWKGKQKFFFQLFATKLRLIPLWIFRTRTNRNFIHIEIFDVKIKSWKVFASFLNAPFFCFFSFMFFLVSL